MAKIKNIMDDDSLTYDAFDDEIDIAITTDQNIDDAISKTMERQLDGDVESPLTEAMFEAYEDPDFSNAGDGSMKIDINYDYDVSNVAPKADFVDMDADDFTDAAKDLAAHADLDDDDIIDLISDMD